MPDLITLDVLDRDGATRAQLLKAGAGFVAGGVLFGGLVSPAEAAISTRRKSKRNDVKILNYALTLEYLEAEFYKRARDSGGLTDPAVKRFAQVVADHEAAHVAALKDVLGRAAVKSPRFDFGDTVTNQAKFKQTAQVLEDTGVAAYAGQGPNVFQRPVVVAALSIHSVEARHAAWIRFINEAPPAPADFDKALSERAVLRAVGATGFIKG